MVEVGRLLDEEEAGPPLEEGCAEAELADMGQMLSPTVFLSFEIHSFAWKANHRLHLGGVHPVMAWNDREPLPAVSIA